MQVIKQIKKRYIGLFLFLCVMLLVGVFYHHQIDYEFSQALLTQQHTVESAAAFSPLPQIHHVFIILEENKDWQSIYHNPQAPFINSFLLTQGAYAQNYHNVPPTLGSLHPSGPNYILLEAGSLAFPDHTFTTDDPPSATNSTSSLFHISKLLDQTNQTWKAYQENISGRNCPITSEGNYAPKHNPFIYFRDVSGNPPSSTNAYCQSHIRPMQELAIDLASGHVAQYVFITPNLQNDMHDGTITQGDAWLANIVPLITSSPTFKKDGALFITWDEGAGPEENNPIGMIMYSPFIKKGYTNATLYSHASYVKTIEEIFHLTPLIGFSADPTTIDLSDFFLTHN